MRKIDMTRNKLAVFFAAALALLWSYEIATTVNSGSEPKIVTLLGLGFAIALLVVELRTIESDKLS
jgi:hypothetical protein